MRQSKDETWLNVAAEIAHRSTCLRRAVGCVLVDSRGHVLSTGYNGVAPGQPHCNEQDGMKMMGVSSTIEMPHYPHACPGAHAARSGENLDGCYAIHAEQNALLQCRDPWAIDTCYVTHSPCVTCAKLLRATSARRVIFSTRYAQDDAARAVFQREDGTPREWVLAEKR
jgi:dCMP deaminase